MPTVSTGTVTPLPPGTPVTLGAIPAVPGQLASLSIDRTVSGGLNSAAGTTTVTLAVQASVNGTTWYQIASVTPTGGGSQASDTLAVSLAPGEITRAVATASASVSVTPTLAAI